MKSLILVVGIVCVTALAPCQQRSIVMHTSLTLLINLSLLTVGRMRRRVLAILTHLTVTLLVDHASWLAGVWAGHITGLSRLIANGWQLGTRSWLVRGSLSWLRLIRLTVYLGGSRLGSAALFFLFALSLLLLLACLPFLADLFEFYF
jgi:hypothetical protein